MLIRQLGSVRNFFTTLGWLFPRIESRIDINSAAWCAFLCSDRFRAVCASMNRVAYSICQFGSWVRSVVFGVEHCAERISPKAAKNRHAEIRWSGTRARLISPPWNFAMNETRRLNIRHTATASADSADTRIAVGQAFQPDTSGCQAGKPDLLQAPLSSNVPGHCIFAYFLLCGLA
jgi:hypothetical protein